MRDGDNEFYVKKFQNRSKSSEVPTKMRISLAMYKGKVVERRRNVLACSTSSATNNWTSIARRGVARWSSLLFELGELLAHDHQPV